MAWSMVSLRRTNTLLATFYMCMCVCVNVCLMLPDDVDLNSVASIPGMGIPEQLKAAMEQEQSSKSQFETPWTSCCNVS